MARLRDGIPLRTRSRTHSLINRGYEGETLITYDSEGLEEIIRSWGVRY